MSVTGKNTLSLRKKDVINQKTPAIGFKKTMFAHKATAGDTGIALGALVTPTEMAGFTNPTAGEIQAAQLYFYRKNFTLISSLRGPLMDYLSYNVASSSQINFNGFTAEEGEIFIGVIDYNARTGLQMVDASTIVASGTLAIGSTDFNVGQVFQTNKFQSQQIGAVLVFRNGVQQFRNTGNSSTTLDGNYYEVDNGSGSSQVIRFNNAPVSQSDSILVVSNGAVAYSPDGSALQAIETLAGQIDAMVPTLAGLAGVPQTDFQAAPNNADLKSFGDTVLDQGNRIIALENQIISYQTKVCSANNTTPSTNLAGMTFNGLEIGKTYMLQGAIVHNRNAGADLQIDLTGAFVKADLLSFEESTTAFGSQDVVGTFFLIFTATSSGALNFLNNTGGTATILATKTFATLFELPSNYVETTKWT